MKLNELILIREDDSANHMDLRLDARQDPSDDLFVQQSSAHRHKPVITLRHINKLKRMKLAQRDETEQRKVLLSLMYAAPSAEEESI